MVTWWIYNIYITLLVSGLKLASLFHTKAQKAVLGRKKIILPPSSSKKRVIIHCASLGEFEQAKPVIEFLKSESDVEIILTFFSPSGYENVNSHKYFDYKLYLPFDQNSRITKFLDQVRPDVIIFIKYEFWWNFIRAALNRNIPFFFVSVSIPENHYLLKRWSGTFRQVLKNVDHLFTIDQSTFNNLRNVGFNNISVAGDTRVSSILNRKTNASKNNKLEIFKSNKSMIILGSTYTPEHQALIAYLNEFKPEFKIAVFPHEINEKHITQLKSSLPIPTALYSDDVENIEKTSVLIVDCIGLLADAYQYATLAYVGGGFGKSIHNILEPFVYKIPLIFGPKYYKFYEAVYLSHFEFVKIVNKPDEVFIAIQDLINKFDFHEMEKAYDHIFEGAEIDKITRIISDTIKQK